ncbi:UNKNOWN [Stylonychia lemnae]|uniref:Transmembrane protein n=1 Tax=Stylonychia lemnae TaxID=5949 RepID=A0A078AVW5_STYLE|nr:UNKNOWN [Stylonychia lemnae]|eukprot:CDW86585.1 UNKNOWN [Stylonychia lemnae]
MPDDPELQYKVGWLTVAVTLGNLLINMSYMTYLSIKKLTISIKSCARVTKTKYQTVKKKHFPIIQQFFLTNLTLKSNNKQIIQIIKTQNKYNATKNNKKAFQNINTPKGGNAQGPEISQVLDLTNYNYTNNEDIFMLSEQSNGDGFFNLKRRFEKDDTAFVNSEVFYLSNEDDLQIMSPEYKYKDKLQILPIRKLDNQNQENIEVVQNSSNNFSQLQDDNIFMDSPQSNKFSEDNGQKFNRMRNNSSSQNTLFREDEIILFKTKEQYLNTMSFQQQYY